MNSTVARAAINYKVHPKPVPIKRTHTGDVPPKVERSAAKTTKRDATHPAPPSRIPRSTGDVRQMSESSGARTSSQHTGRMHPPVKNKTGSKDMAIGYGAKGKVTGPKANGDTMAPSAPEHAVGGQRPIPSGYYQDHPDSVGDDQRTDKTYDPKSGPMRRWSPPPKTGQASRKYKTLQLKDTTPVSPPKNGSRSQRVKNMLRNDYTGPDKGVGIARNQ